MEFRGQAAKFGPAAQLGKSTFPITDVYPSFAPLPLGGQSSKAFAVDIKLALLRTSLLSLPLPKGIRHLPLAFRENRISGPTDSKHGI